MTTIRKIEAWALRAPIETPIMTSFGKMRDRPAVFVRLEDSDGAFGWGEIFANWPIVAAEHRVNLLAVDIAPLLLGRDPKDPAELFRELSKAVHVRALQSGEWGPFRQVVAGLDIALWDLAARRAGLPLARLLKADAPLTVPAYASGIGIDTADRMIPLARRDGFQAFKVKVGFNLDRELDRICAIASRLDPKERLFADANQAWNLNNALRFVESSAAGELGWIEEPMPADAPEDEWRRLADESPVALAGGENLAGLDAFAYSLGYGQFYFVQPDATKWGGITGCLEVAGQVLSAGRIYCPHFLGGGIGLMASAHLLAAAGGPGLLEVDVNANPLRDAFTPTAERIASNGRFRLDDTPGLGIDGLAETVLPLTTLYQETTA